MSNQLETKTLGEVCEFRRGLTYKKSDEVTKSKNAVLRANNINLATNSLDLSEIRYINENISVADSKKVVRDSILICVASGSKIHLGKVALIDDDYDFAFGGFMGLLVVDKSVILPKYLYLILISEQFRQHIHKLMAGANINNLKFSQIEDFPIDVPSLSEQERIVKILDEKFVSIDELKQVTEGQILNVTELYNSKWVDIFENQNNFPVVEASEVITEVKTGPFGSALHKSDYVNDGIPVINPQDIFEGKIAHKGKAFISEATKERLKKYVLKPGDIIMARRGEMGRCALVTEQESGWLCGTGSLIIRFDSRVAPAFFNEVLRSEKVKRYLTGNAVGTTMSNLNQEIINSIPVTLPPINEQKKILGELNKVSDSVSQLKEKFVEKLLHIEELKKSYLQSAFAGKL